MLEWPQALLRVVMGRPLQTAELILQVPSLWLPFCILGSELNKLDALAPLVLLSWGNARFHAGFPVLLGVMSGIVVLPTTHGEHWMRLIMVDNGALNVSFVGSELLRG